jgi:putative flavoprotein involved in K+ transport
LYTWGSGRFSGVAKDARYLVDQISSDRAESLIQGKRAAAR